MRDTASSYDFEVRWLPFQLRPGHPREGVPKAPDTPDNPRVGARLKAAGASVGIDFTGKTDRSPNTVLAHTLLSHALETKGAAVQDSLSEVLFRHYFTDGLYPDQTNLLLAAKEVGLDLDAATAALNNSTKQEKVQQEAEQMSRQGVRGVPFFFVNGSPAFSGAQDPEAFKQVFKSSAGAGIFQQA